MSSKYLFDDRLPAGGHRCKKDNEGLILLHLQEHGGSIMTLDECYKNFFLAINTSENTYNAELREDTYGTEGAKPNRYPMQLTTAILNSVVELATNEDFMSLTEEDVQGEFMVLDGMDVLIDLKANGKRFNVDTNVMMDVTENGTIEAKGKIFKTKLHLIFKRMEKMAESISNQRFV